MNSNKKLKRTSTNFQNKCQKKVANDVYRLSEPLSEEHKALIPLLVDTSPSAHNAGQMLDEYINGGK